MFTVKMTTVQKRLLIIEDETSLAKQLKWGLSKDYEIAIASNPKRARALLSSGAYPVATLDLGLPPHPDTSTEGFKLLEELPSLSSYTKIIVITGNAEEENAIKAISLGAADFCAKPIDLKLLKIVLSRTFRIYELEEANRRLHFEGGESCSLCGMLGVSPAMNKLFNVIRQVSTTDYPVLITGESGVGKEMVARALYALSNRSQKPFVAINCGAIPENLLESELFGHEKGAFTGAVKRKVGKFEYANGGTIFLDEIGELPFHLQVKILRVLQEGTIEPLGTPETISLNVRVFASTNVNLKQAMDEGRFREDLYYRLNVVPIKVPPLRDRPEDVLLLAHHFLQEEAQKLRRGQVTFSPAAIAALTGHSWPGNVRELQNRVRRALSTDTDKVISLSDLDLGEAPVEQEAQKVFPLKLVRKKAEIDAIRKAMLLAGNNISKAAKLLEISRPTLHDLFKKHQITF